MSFIFISLCDPRREDESVCVCFKECTMQQFVPRYMDIRWSLGIRFGKKYVVATMKHPVNHNDLGCHVELWPT